MSEAQKGDRVTVYPVRSAPITGTLVKAGNEDDDDGIAVRTDGGTFHCLWPEYVSRIVVLEKGHE